MSRSGYSDDHDQWEMIRWSGAVQKALAGKRGQAFLKEMLEALDGLPEKVLVESALEENGAVCAIGAVGMARGVDMAPLDPECSWAIAKAFGIANAMVCEIEFQNDEAVGYWSTETPEQRFVRMRAWVVGKIRG